MKIQANPALLFDKRDLGLRVNAGVLEAPPAVAQVLARLGVEDAVMLLPMIDDLPSAFIGYFKLSLEELATARAALDAELRSYGVQSIKTRHVERSFGARSPKKIP